MMAVVSTAHCQKCDWVAGPGDQADVDRAAEKHVRTAGHPVGTITQTNRKDTTMSHHNHAGLAAIDLDAVKYTAGHIDLDGDPQEVLRLVNVIHGRVAALRAYAKRRIAAAAPPEPGTELGT